MERLAVRSRDIAIVGYEKETRTLEVAFRSGSVYRYTSVPAETHESLLGASSQGIFFRDHIRDRFQSEKVA